MEGGSKIEEDTKSSNQKNNLKMRRINVLKTNIIRLMPKKLGCSRFLKKEEKLFVHGIERYQKRINLTTFIKNIEKIKYDTEKVTLDVERIKNNISQS